MDVSKRLIILGAVALVVGLVAAGCGEDSSTASITKAQFVKKANAICAKVGQEVVSDFASYAKENKNLKTPTEADYADLVDAVMTPNIEKEVTELEALGAPSGDEDTVEELIDSRAATIEKAEAEPSLLLNESDELFAESSKLATEYGLDECDDR